MWKQYHIDNLDMENVCNYNYKHKENIYNNFYVWIDIDINFIKTINSTIEIW